MATTLIQVSGQVPQGAPKSEKLAKVRAFRSILALSDEIHLHKVHLYSLLLHLSEIIAHLVELSNRKMPDCGCASRAKPEKQASWVMAAK